MGWASGSEIAEEIWDLIEADLSLKNKKKIAGKLIDIFEDADCDTMSECEELCRVAGRYQDDDAE